jgi:cobalt-zinc-cadmium efflux system outer membrane protein
MKQLHMKSKIHFIIATVMVMSLTGMVKAQEKELLSF